MAQLRHDYSKFKALNTEVLMVVPNGPRLIEKHIKVNATPYPILSDKGAKVAAQYFIDTRRAVRLDFFPPSVFLVDQMGKILYTDYLTSYIMEPDNQEPLAVLTQLKVNNYTPALIPA
jgi:peroxiredoxin